MIDQKDYSNIQWLLGYLRGSVALMPEKHQETILDILQELDVLIDKYQPNANQT